MAEEAKQAKKLEAAKAKAEKKLEAAKAKAEKKLATEEAKRCCVRGGRTAKKGMRRIKNIIK